MNACGYNRSWKPIKSLKELTFICSKEEIAALARFFAAAKETLCDNPDPQKDGFVPINGRYCMELQIWDEQWPKENPAIIVYVEDADGLPTLA